MYLLSPTIISTLAVHFPEDIFHGHSNIMLLISCGTREYSMHFLFEWEVLRLFSRWETLYIHNSLLQFYPGAAFIILAENSYLNSEIGRNLLLGCNSSVHWEPTWLFQKTNISSHAARVKDCWRKRRPITSDPFTTAAALSNTRRAYSPKYSCGRHWPRHNRCLWIVIHRSALFFSIP